MDELRPTFSSLFSLVPAWPDYHQAFPGSVRGGRSLSPKPFDGRRPSTRFLALRPPVATTLILGGMMVGRGDLTKFYSMTRSWSSAARVTTLVMRSLRDRLTGHRVTQETCLRSRPARSRH